MVDSLLQGWGLWMDKVEKRLSALEGKKECTEKADYRDGYPVLSKHLSLAVERIIEYGHNVGCVDNGRWIFGGYRFKTTIEYPDPQNEAIIRIRRVEDE